MKRVAVFAHYDKHNKIQDYVVFYIKKLKEIADKVIFVSDSNVSKEELSKISNYIDFSIIEHHGEYDFGSYKRGYLYAKDSGFLNDCEEFIICNDSCYGPIQPFDKVFDKMKNSNADFWGITENFEGLEERNGEILYCALSPHIQSYFIVFRKNVLNSEVFDTFFKTIEKQENKLNIILKYEIGLSKLLVNNGFKYDAYSDFSKHFANSQILFYKKLIEENIPLVKTSIYRYTDIRANIFPDYKILNKYTDYDINLIKKDLKYNKNVKAKFRYPLRYLKHQRRKVIRLSTKKRELQLFEKIYKF